MPPARSWAAAPHLPAPLFRASHGPSSDCAFPVAVPGLCHSSPEGLWRLCRVWKRGSWEGELQGLLCLGLTLDAQPSLCRKAQALEEALRAPQLPREAVAGFRSLLWTCQALGFGTGRQLESTAAAVELGWLEELRGAQAQTDVAVDAHQSSRGCGSTKPRSPDESSWLVTPAGSHRSYLGRLFFFFFLSKYDN